MEKLVNKDSLSLTYKALGIDGLVKTKSITLNNISSEALDEDIYQAALMIKDLLAYSTEKIARKIETLYVEN